jgi:hypothetical protein
MTDLAPYQPATIEVHDPTGGRLVAWANAASAANQLAKALARTSFVPASFKGNDADATAAIIMGDELGLSPLAALRSIYVIHGQPAMYARTMVALAQSHGHEVWTEKATDNEVVVCGRRRGSEHVERSAWTMTRAQKAGYTKNNKYASNPQEMLYSKAAAEVSRKVAADVLAGVPYSVEDLELEVPQPRVTVTRADQEAPTTRVRRAVPTEAAPEPEPEPPFDDGPPDDVPEPITRPQLTKLHVLFGENNMDRDASLAWISGLLDRDVTSSKELSKTEASRLIDTLENPTTDTPETRP